MTFPEFEAFVVRAFLVAGALVCAAAVIAGVVMFLAHVNDFVQGWRR